MDAIRRGRAAALAAALVLLLAGCVSAPSRVTEPPYPFTTDGCSDPTPAKRFKNPAYEQACCVPHDRAYWRGGSFEDRRRADEALRACVADRGFPNEAVAMFVAVRLGGGPEFHTPYRWGYGYPFPHPYTRKD